MNRIQTARTILIIDRRVFWIDAADATQIEQFVAIAHTEQSPVWINVCIFACARFFGSLELWFLFVFSMTTAQFFLLHQSKNRRV